MKHILIDNHGVPVEQCGYSLPWKNDSVCMNFNRPDEIIDPDDIEHISNDVETLVIGCDLKDYSFIDQLINLKELYLYEGKNVTDLSFVENLVYLKQLMITGSHVSTVEPVKKLLEKKKEMIGEGKDFMHDWYPYVMEGICVESYQNISDMDELLSYRRYLSELIFNGHHLLP